MTLKTGVMMMMMMITTMMMITIGDNDDSDDSLEDDHRPRRSHHHWEGEYDFMASQLVYNAHFTLLWRLPYMWWEQ